MKGHCLCKNVSLEWNTATEIVTPRRCGCSFCTARNICWVGEPDSRLQVMIQDASLHNVLKQGTETADFHQCLGCEQIVFASCVIDGEHYAVINAATLVDQHKLTNATDTDFDEESLDVRLARRKAKWCYLEAFPINTADLEASN